MVQRGTWSILRKKLVNISAALVLLAWQATASGPVFAVEEPGGSGAGDSSVVTDPEGDDTANTDSTTVEQNETTVTEEETIEETEQTTVTTDDGLNTNNDSVCDTTTGNGCDSSNDVVGTETILNDTQADSTIINNQRADSGDVECDKDCCKNECEEKRAKLVIIKHVDRHSDRKFHFKAHSKDSDHSMDDFKLSGNHGDNSVIFADLRPGEFEITEAKYDGWKLKHITCVGSDDWHWSGNGSTKLRIKLHKDDNVTCIFKNFFVTVVTPPPPVVTPPPVVEVPPAVPPVVEEVPPPVVEQPPVLAAQAPMPVGGKGGPELVPTGSTDVIMNMFAGSAILIILAALTYVTTRKSQNSTNK